MTPSKRFRPVSYPKRFVIRQRRLTGAVINYNYQERVTWNPAGWGLSKRVLGRLFNQLHYLACHAPTPVKQRWQENYKNFKNRFIPRRASVRYIKTIEWL
jgi:hypothetical protein